MIEASVQFRLRFTLGNQVAFGPGKAELLRSIDSEGSITRSAKKMGMSYKRAWLLINEMNTLFCSPLVETSTGGDKGGGARLSTSGREVLAHYDQIEKDSLENSEKLISEIKSLLIP